MLMKALKMFLSNLGIKLEVILNEESLKNQSCSLNRLKLKKTKLKEKLQFPANKLRITLK